MNDPTDAPVPPTRYRDVYISDAEDAVTLLQVRGPARLRIPSGTLLTDLFIREGDTATIINGALVDLPGLMRVLAVPQESK